jgi:sterol 3beta-glucosyltransferase
MPPSSAGSAPGTLVVPFVGGQLFWADRLAGPPIAPPALAAEHLTTRALSQAIDFVEQAQVQKTAARLGEHIAGENGLATAVMAIEKLLGE